MAATTGRTGWNHECTFLEHEDKGGYTSFAAFANELVGLDGHAFERSLRVITCWLREIAVRAEPVIPIRRVRAFRARRLHAYVSEKRGEDCHDEQKKMKKFT